MNSIGGGYVCRNVASMGSALRIAYIYVINSMLDKVVLDNETGVVLKWQGDLGQ